MPECFLVSCTKFQELFVIAASKAEKASDTAQPALADVSMEGKHMKEMCDPTQQKSDDALAKTEKDEKYVKGSIERCEEGTEGAEYLKGRCR